MRNKMRKKWLFVGMLIGCLGIILIFYIYQQQATQSGEKLLRPVQVGVDHLQVYEDGRYQNLFVKGVNLGLTKPGSFPLDGAITKEDYRRWIQQIGDMGANVIRVYSPHPPAFYQELLTYNQTATQPIYIMQGIWVDEALIEDKKNMFNQQIEAEFTQKIEEAVQVVHGDYRHKQLFKGQAYDADVSPYIIGFVLGMEWAEDVVQQTNTKNHKIDDYKGGFVTTIDAQPMEVFLAQQLDDLVTYETDNYQMMHPVSFINWVPTDTLTHEMVKKERTASINDLAITATDRFAAGLFTTFHVYPYYPDFLNVEEKYVNYQKNDGTKDNFAGYLHALKEQIQRPIIIGEFGVPSSRGRAHENVHGMHQGGLTEDEQGAIDTTLFEDVVSEQLAGAVLFSWQDEWYKSTWNTKKTDDPDYRHLWSNVQSSEEHYGLLTFELLSKADAYRPTWNESNVTTITSNDEKILQQVRMTSDARYLYLGLEYEDDFEQFETTLFFNTLPKSGNKQWEDIRFSSGIDFYLQIDNAQSIQLFVDEYYDPFTYEYGLEKEYLPINKTLKKNSGRFVPIRLPLNEPDKRLGIPFAYYETGELYASIRLNIMTTTDALTDVILSPDRRRMEIRLPWALLNISNPSRKTILGDFHKNGMDSRETIKQIQLAYTLSKNDTRIESFPTLTKRRIDLDEGVPFTWNDWTEVHYEERLKSSYYTLKEAFSKVSIEE